MGTSYTVLWSFLFDFWLVFMSFSDTESVFLDVALLLEIIQGSPFHFMTIWANTLHS